MNRRTNAANSDSHSGVHISLMLYSVLIATSFPVGEALASLVSPTVLTSLRFLNATLVFLFVLLVRRELLLPSRRLLAKCAVLALLMALFFCLMFKSLQTASALNAGAIFTFSPLLSLFFGLVINQVGGSIQQVGALVIGAVGATWVVFDGNPSELLTFRLDHGEQLFLLCTICFSLYSPFAKRFISNENIVSSTFWVLVFSAMFTVSFSLFHDGLSAFYGLPAYVWGGAIYLAIFPTAVTFFISIRASTMISPFKVTSYVYLVPAFVALMDLALFGRAVSASVMCGIAVAAMATLLIQRGNFNARSRTMVRPSTGSRALSQNTTKSGEYER